MPTGYLMELPYGTLLDTLLKKNSSDNRQVNNQSSTNRIMHLVISGLCEK